MPTGKLDDVGGKLLLIISPCRNAALRRAMLSEHEQNWLAVPQGMGRVSWKSPESDKEFAAGSIVETKIQAARDGQPDEPAP